MKKLLAHIPIAVIGGLVYMGIEILWRGHTHWTMGVLGGLCFVLIGLLDEWQDHPPMLLQMVQGAAIVTALELIVGLIVNRWLGWNVWDYSDMPFNLWGQVCLQFAVAWFSSAPRPCGSKTRCTGWRCGLRTGGGGDFLPG